MQTAQELIEKADAAVGALDTAPVDSSRKLVLIRVSDSQRRSAFLQRELNVAVAFLALIALLPLMLLIAVLIKVTSRGPVLFKQDRVGLDRRQGQRGGNWRRHIDYGGKLFTMYKFRTMYVQDGPAEQVWASKDDPRVTPLGRFLRSYRLDELPQLFNVLKGDMNVVGPRPEQPNIFLWLRPQLNHYEKRQRVLPGITGWAQINLQYDRGIEDVRKKLRYDLAYAARQSALEDIRTMIRTVPVVISRRGAW